MGMETQDTGDTGLTLLHPSQRHVERHETSNGRGGGCRRSGGLKGHGDRTGGLQGGARSGTHGGSGSLGSHGRSGDSGGHGEFVSEAVAPVPAITAGALLHPPKISLGEVEARSGTRVELWKCGLLWVLWKRGLFGRALERQALENAVEELALR